MGKKGVGRKLVLTIFLSIIFLIVAIISSFFIICRHEIKSVASLKTLDEYGMFEMTYYDDYNLNSLLEQGIKNPEELTDFIINTHSNWFPIKKSMKINFDEGGCTAFFVQNSDGNFLFGRNFDFPYSPSLLLHTNPSDGYASVSTVNLHCLGYNQSNLPKVANDQEFKFVESGYLLATPYLPYDGMNEMGVAIALLTLPEGQAPFSDDKVTINTTLAIRLVLDRAASVEEAVALLTKYNIYFANNIPCQFFIGDSSGTSIIMEFIDGEIQLIYPDSNYQIASNFIAYKNDNTGYGQDRYKAVKSAIESRNHKLSNDVALELLAHVGMRSNGIDMLQWSVLYNTNNLTGEIFAHRKFDNRSFFALN